MSLETWKKEFYPEEAKTVIGDKAIAHSLRKWEGLTPENLVKHGIVRKKTRLIANREDDFYVDCDSCALCVHYLNYAVPEDQNECVACPLFKLIGASCVENDSDTVDKNQIPFQIWWRTGNAQPMIDALRKLRDDEMNERRDVPTDPPKTSA
jgi:hypothetical protein